MPRDFNIVVIISGRGSNLKSLIDGARNYRISAVFSNKLAPGLAYARERDIPCRYFPREEFSSVSEQKAALFANIEMLSPDLVCLAGYMQLVPPEFVHRHFGRVINIHPSLLPQFPGLDTHHRAIEAGVTRHGCSVHYVDAAIDTGPLIAQAGLDTRPGELETDLSARVLALEHRLYPWVVNGIASGEITIEDGTVRFSGERIRQAADNGFVLPAVQ